MLSLPLYLKKELPTITIDKKAEILNTKKCTAIGVGTQGIIYRKEIGKGKFALKVFTEHITEEERAIEIEILQHISNENIVNIRALLQEKEASCYSGYVMDLMDTNLGRVIYDTTIEGEEYHTHLESWFKQAVNAITYIHKLDIIHRDIKPCNFLLGNKNRVLKLCDWGSACLRPDHDLDKDIGTYHYMAPEIISGGQKHRKRSDVYSFAVTMWEVVTRRSPYDETDDRISIPMRVKDGARPNTVDPKFYLPEGKEIYLNYTWRCIWDPNPKKRPKIKQLKLIIRDKRIKAGVNKGEAQAKL